MLTCLAGEGGHLCFSYTNPRAIQYFKVNFCLPIEFENKISLKDNKLLVLTKKRKTRVILNLAMVIFNHLIVKLRLVGDF